MQCENKSDAYSSSCLRASNSSLLVCFSAPGVLRTLLCSTIFMVLFFSSSYNKVYTLLKKVYYLKQISHLQETVIVRHHCIRHLHHVHHSFHFLHGARQILLIKGRVKGTSKCTHFVCIISGKERQSRLCTPHSQQPNKTVCHSVSLRTLVTTITNL